MHTDEANFHTTESDDQHLQNKKKATGMILVAVVSESL
jgi:hypothetical protein